MRTQTHTLLKMTPDEYDRLFYSAYMQYCEEHSTSEMQLQFMLCDNTLFNWWCNEAFVFIEQFHEVMETFEGKLDQLTAISSYMDHVEKVTEYYNSMLIRSAQKSKIINQN